jgi:hypothetical protein
MLLLRLLIEPKENFVLVSATFNFSPILFLFRSLASSLLFRAFHLNPRFLLSSELASSKAPGFPSFSAGGVDSFFVQIRFPTFCIYFMV